MSWWIGGIACAGVLASHWLTYRVLHLEGHLHETGHDHLGVTSAVAVGLFVAAALRFCALGLRGQATPGFGALVLRLTAVQAAVWLGMETAERAASGSLSTLDDHALLVVGLLVQVVVAVVGATAVRLAGRTLAAVVARRAARPDRRRVPVHPRWRDRVPHTVRRWGAQGVRGPPASHAAAV